MPPLKVREAEVPRDRREVRRREVLIRVEADRREEQHQEAVPWRPTQSTIMQYHYCNEDGTGNFRNATLGFCARLTGT